MTNKTCGTRKTILSKAIEFPDPLEKEYGIKTIVKQFVIVLVLAVMAAPAMAAEISKGTKSYQRSDKPAEQSASKTQDAEDVAKISPAAGDQEAADTNFFKKTFVFPAKIDPGKN